MRLRPCHGLGETLVQATLSCREQIDSDVKSDAGVVAKLFASCRKPMVKTASSRPEVHFYVDPKLAENYKINLHLIDAEAEPSERIVSAEKKLADFSEETVSFISKRQYEPNYLCSIVFQKPDDEVYAISAYLMETYLGRYAFRANWYFRKTSKSSAVRCYNRVLTAIKDLKSDFLDRDLKQNELPHFLRRALQGESGEIEPKINQMATYLNPKNVASGSTVASDNIVTVPSRRSIKDDLIMD